MPISYSHTTISPPCSFHRTHPKSHYPSEPTSQSRPHRARTLYTSLRSLTCFGTAARRQKYSSLSTDSLPLLTEKLSFYPLAPDAAVDSADTSNRTLPPSPQRLTRWPSSKNLSIRESVVGPSQQAYDDAMVPPADERGPISTRNRAGTTLETELADELAVMDQANMLGAMEVALGPRRDQGTQIGITIEPRRSEEHILPPIEALDVRRESVFV